MANKTATRGDPGFLIFDWLPVQEKVIKDAIVLGEFTMVALDATPELVPCDDTASITPHGFVTKIYDNTDDGISAEVHFGLLELLGNATIAAQAPGVTGVALYNDQVEHKGGAVSNNIDVGVLFSTISDLSNGVWFELTPAARALATLL